MTPSTVEEALKPRRCPICDADYICGHAVFKPIGPLPIEAQGSEPWREALACMVFNVATGVSIERTDVWAKSLALPVQSEAMQTLIRDCRDVAALTRPDPSLGGEPEGHPHNPTALQTEAEAMLQHLQDAWDYDATMGDACDMDDEWSRAAEHRWKRTKRALEIIRSTDPAAVSPPSLGMEGVREDIFALIPRDPGSCEGDDSHWLLTFLNTLHAHLPEDERPTAWMQFSDEQRTRIQAAYRAMIASISTPSGEVG